MGKESRTPSVEARVVETKQNFSGSLENVLFTLFTHFCSISIVHFFFLLQLFSFYCFLLLFYTDLFSFGVRLFLGRG
jgi:hypothetical protein